MIQTNSPVTTQTHFSPTEGRPLFSVNPGIPVDDALEQATILLGCIEHLVVCDASTSKGSAAATLQYLSEMARAVVAACKKEPVQA